MKKTERQAMMLKTLAGARGAITGAALAERFGVSRQTVVKDIDALRSIGAIIEPTASGYRLAPRPVTCLVACRHETVELMRKELMAVVLEGGTVMDVLVQHTSYGPMRRDLMIHTIHDVDRFLKTMETDNPLCALTGGLHMHTIRTPDQRSMDGVLDSLEDLHILVE